MQKSPFLPVSAHSECDGMMRPGVRCRQTPLPPEPPIRRFFYVSASQPSGFFLSSPDLDASQRLAQPHRGMGGQKGLISGWATIPKPARALTAIEVKRLAVPGLHPVGTVAGLRLSVKDTGATSWVLRAVAPAGAPPAPEHHHATALGGNTCGGCAGCDQPREAKCGNGLELSDQHNGPWTVHQHRRQASATHSPRSSAHGRQHRLLLLHPLHLRLFRR